MGIIGGTSRLYGGEHGKLARAQGWTCPACGNANVVPQEQGCPACGVGTPEEAERAKLGQHAGAIGAEQLAQAVNTASVDKPLWNLPAVNERAFLTLVRALSHYAEHGRPLPDELPAPYVLAWARDLNRLLGD